MIRINQELNYRKAPIASGSVFTFDFQSIAIKTKTPEGTNVKSWKCTMQLQWYVSEGIEGDYANKPLGKPDEFPTMSITKTIDDAAFASAFVNEVNTFAIVEKWVVDAIKNFDLINASNVEQI